MPSTRRARIILNPVAGSDTAPDYAPLIQSTVEREYETALTLTTGSGDADLYVKRGAEPTTSIYDCRPFTGSSDESCTPGTFNASGPAKFWVGIHGYGSRP